MNKTTLEKQISIEADSQGYVCDDSDIYEIAKNIINTVGLFWDCFSVQDAIHYYYSI